LIFNQLKEHLNLKNLCCISAFVFHATNQALKFEQSLAKKGEQKANQKKKKKIKIGVQYKLVTFATLKHYSLLLFVMQNTQFPL